MRLEGGVLKEVLEERKFGAGEREREGTTGREDGCYLLVACEPPPLLMEGGSPLLFLRRLNVCTKGSWLLWAFPFKVIVFM